MRISDWSSDVCSSDLWSERRVRPLWRPLHLFSDIEARKSGLRQKYDVIVYPNVVASPRAQIEGVPRNGNAPIPYKKSALTPNLGAQDRSEERRVGNEGVST